MDRSGTFPSAEVFDPATMQFEALPGGASSPRAYHTATR
jgi:hypothetical protein